ncbi:MAG: glycosyltransferase family 2 protein [Lachnospiraceae bacterium]|nr:glycosyltransferase family 2 protein [Lachnospiraceae bacterium]
MSKVSFVIPCYRSEKTLESVIDEIRETMRGLTEYTYDIVLVNDASPDGTWNVIRRLTGSVENIIGINLSRNFGQHAALMAGYSYTDGDIVVSLDDDGQTPADEVGKLLKKIEEGSDVVYAKYTHKQHSGFRNLGSRINELMTRVMLGKPKELYVSSYFAARRFIIDEILRYRQSYPYVIGLVLRSTSNISNVEVTHRARTVGSSGYTFGKLMGLWMNGFTAFSIKPLRIATAIGFVSTVISLIYGIYTIVKKFVRPDVPIGFSALVCIILFVGGVMMIMQGMIGEYLGRTYMSVNETPQFVIREITGAKW